MKTRNLSSTLLALGFTLATVPLVAAPQSFDFKDPKGVNNAVFKLDAPLEAINGTASGISGTVTYDPANPASLKGRIVVDAKSLVVPNPMMKDHLHGDQWLDVARHPEISFEAKKVANVKQNGDNSSADVTGTFTVKGVSKDITVPVRFTYLKDKLAARTNGQAQGDLLVIRANFAINRSDFGINPKAPADKVAEEIELTLSLAGASPRK